MSAKGLVFMVAKITTFVTMLQRLGILLLLCVLLTGCGAPSNESGLKAGDLLFQDLDCGPMCDAIEAVTEGAQGKDFSHCAMVVKVQDSLEVLEAMGKGVVLTSLKDFKARSPKILVGRLKNGDEAFLNRACAYGLSLQGKPYDDAFMLNNDRYYCSELIYEAFKTANYGKAWFPLEPMTFKVPGSQTFYPIWVKYYATLNCPIPEGKPGLNPGSISRSESLTLFELPF